MWLRFTDDIFGIWQFGLDSSLEFVEFVNTCFQTLKFILEYSYTESFLGVLVKIDDTFNITTDLFKKKRLMLGIVL